MSALHATRAAEVAALLGSEQAAEALERHGTPVLLLQPERVRAQYHRLVAALPFVDFYYAVKALAHPAVIDALAAEGCGFDVATVEELDLVLGCDVTVERTIFTHPVKKPSEIVEATRRGVRMFVVDSLSEIDKLASGHPRAQVLIRLAYRNPEAKSDLSAKFGIDVPDAEALVLRALELGLHVVGFSYHVGSQLDDPSRFAGAVVQTLALMDDLETRVPVRFEILDIGGGFPVAYDQPVVSIEVLADAIRPLLEPRAGELRIIAEPGRFLVAEAATLVTSVCGTTRRRGRNWLYLDDGVYGAYSNVVAEDVHPLLFPVKRADAVASAPSPVLVPTTVAGPTCDSADVVADALLPELAIGDLLASPVMGAYTVVTATSFNGRQVTPVAVLDHVVQPAVSVAAPV